jgi:hypothetical protein
VEPSDSPPPTVPPLKSVSPDELPHPIATLASAPAKPKTKFRVPIVHLALDAMLPFAGRPGRREIALIKELRRYFASFMTLPVVSP